MTDPATKLKTFVDCVYKAAAIAVPQKVCRKKETPWMNADLKTLIQERNRLRRDMGANRDAWVAKTRKVLEKTQEAKRSTWRAHLEEVTRTKDAKKAWAVVKSLNGSARAQDGKTIVHKGCEYVSDNAKASAFIQDFANVSGQKSDRSSRRAVRELQSGVCRLLGSPRQELEQAVTPEELATALKKPLFVSVEFHGDHKTVTRLSRMRILPDLKQWCLSVNESKSQERNQCNMPQNRYNSKVFNAKAIQIKLR